MDRPGTATDLEAGGVAAARLAAALRGATDGPAGDLADRLCLAAVTALGARGASLCALLAPGMSVPVGVSDPVAALAERSQFSSGEGPCWEAYRSGAAVVADLCDEGLRLRWPAYARAVAAETDYRFVVSLPVRLTSGPLLVFSAFEAGPPAVRWWEGPGAVVHALREVLDGASAPTAPGGAVWLDSSTTLRRSTVWLAEALMVDEAASLDLRALDHPGALRALRMYSALEGTTVDGAARELVQGRLSTRQVLGGTSR